MENLTHENIIPIRTHHLSDTKFIVSSPVGPIEQKMRLILEKIKDSKYPDTFDWSIYDKIAARYGENQPRGGVVYNKGLKLLNYHTSCSKCHYAFELDTYGRGCVHNCVWCYAKETLTRYGYWNEPIPFPVNLAEIRKEFYTAFETEKSSKWSDLLRKRIPIRLGSMSDSFMWIDKKYKVTLELLKILRHYQYPYIVFTRSDLIADDLYLENLDPKLSSIQFSICGGNEQLTKGLEPGSPSVHRRLEALKKLSEQGFWTTVRINPLFPIYPDGYFTDPDSITKRFGSKANVPKFDLFDWSFIRTLKEFKVPSLLAGMARLTPFAIRAISKETGFDYSLFFKPELFQKTADSRFSDSEISFYYKKIQAECANAGIRFNTCYIGNGEKDYYQYQKLWDNKKDCCDARGNVSAFNASSQEISWEERFRHASNIETAETAKTQEEIFDKIYAQKSNLKPEIQI
jgi:DNA repair photolyase